MSDDSQDRLDKLADAVAEEFDSYRNPSEFKTLSLVIDDSSDDRPTLIVHVDGDDAATLADEIETFLHGQGAPPPTEKSTRNRTSERWRQ